MSNRADERFLTAVAVALGESVALIRSRGFHLDVPHSDGEPRPARHADRPQADEPDDAVDLEAYGLDWDAENDCRPHRGRWRVTVRRKCRRAA